MGYETQDTDLMPHTLEAPSMPSYTITAPAIEYYNEALEQFEHLLDRLMDEPTQRMTHGEVETRVQTAGTELLRRMMQGYFDQRSAEEPVREGVMGKEDGIPKTPKWAEAITGLSQRKIIALAKEWAAKRTVVSCGVRGGFGGAMRLA